MAEAQSLPFLIYGTSSVELQKNNQIMTIFSAILLSKYTDNNMFEKNFLTFFFKYYILKGRVFEMSVF
ncbi:MAG: hypothetical protein SOZ34_07490 [Clostridia bacterium]|nr:hypothetical protein [Clostridia bacterium]